MIVIYMNIKIMIVMSKTGRSKAQGHVATPRPEPPRMVRFGSAAPPVRRVPLPLARRFFQICMTVSAAGLEGSGLTPLEFAILAYVTKDGGEPDIDQTSLAQQVGI